jgi:tape measure domain-containing protein
MSTKVGSIYYDLDLKTKNFDAQRNRVSTGLGAVGGKMVALGKTAAKFGLIAGGVVAGLTIKGGISRALNIEDAQAKLKGLGHDTKAVQKIMDSALDSVLGTAFGLDSAATAAASAVAAGVKPGKELTRVLSLTGDAATIMGREFGESGAIINKVLASNRLSMQEVNQLHDAGLPILSQLADQYGVNADEMRQMVTKGKVDSKVFLNAIEKNIGGAALKSGNTTRGAMANMKAAFSSVGAALVTDLMPKVRDAFNGITKWLKDNRENIVSWATEFANGAGKVIGSTLEWGRVFIKDLIPKVQMLAKVVFDYLQPKLKALWNTINQQLIPALRYLWKEMIEPLLPVVGTLLVAAFGMFIDIVNVTIKVLGSVINWFAQTEGRSNVLKFAIITLISYFAALKLAMGISAAVSSFKAGLASMRFAMAVTKAHMVILKGVILAPMVMPAIAIGAALLAIYKVKQAAEEARAAVQNLANAEKTHDRAQSDTLSRLRHLRDHGTAEQKKRAINALKQAGSFANGGFTGRGNKFDIAGIVHKGEFVLPKEMVNQQTGTPMGMGSTSIFGNVNIGSKQDADYFFDRMNRNQQALGLGLAGGMQ